MFKLSRIKQRIKKAYLKVLKASCKKNWDKVSKLNAKIIGLELQLRKENEQ